MTNPSALPASALIISDARGLLGMTQLRFAGRLGVSRGALAHWERGREPAPPSLVDFCTSLVTCAHGGGVLVCLTLSQMAARHTAPLRFAIEVDFRSSSGASHTVAIKPLAKIECKTGWRYV